jgi:type II secretory pathway pseudopilin PulG
MTLVELLAVMAIIVIMFSLLAPAVNSMTSTAGRKGALNILMNTFEQARAAALESGTNVYVVLWKREFPEPDSVIVLREVPGWEISPNSDASKPAGSSQVVFVPLTRYISLPKGILLYDGKGKNVFKSSPPEDDLFSQLPQAGGISPKKSEIGYVQFSPTGGIQHPEDKDYSRLYVSEGVRGTNGTEALIAGGKERQGGFEIITFRRFTGRASVDVSTID